MAVDDTSRMDGGLLQIDSPIVFTFPLRNESVITCQARVFSLVIKVYMIWYTEKKILGLRLGIGGGL